MSAILSMFSGAWPVILGVLTAAGGVVFGLFKGQEAKTTTAQAATQTAKADAAATQAQAARADADAAQAALTKVQSAATNRQAIEKSVADTVAAGGLDKALKDEGFVG
ncbi:hypothetical protein ACQUFY_20715 [Robbsia andropogonis]|uniref:hypothetical protein n=1 Tax=Robbsia andropogonis TaxID=28092 RepID=UPI003D25AA08